MKIIKLSIPENLDIDKIIKDNRTAFLKHPLKKENLLFICDALIKARVSQRKEMEENETDFANLSSKILDGVVHDYNYYLDFLISSNVIYCDRHFEKGKFCRGYKFNSLYLGQPNKEVIVEGYILKKAIRRSLDNRKKQEVKETRGYKFLTKWFESKKLDIDLEKANKWIDEYEITKIENIKFENKKVAERITNAIETTKDFKMLVQRIKDREYQYSFSGDGHRFYSSITNLKRDLKQYLTYDGKPLVSIDLKNSQPFLSLVLFNPEFWGEKLDKNEKMGLIWLNSGIYKDIKGKGAGEGIITLLNSHQIKDSIDWGTLDSDTIGSGSIDSGSNTGGGIITLLDSHQMKDSIYSGIDNYKKLVLTGLFYEYIQKQLKPKYPERFSDRPKVKKEVMRILFSDPKDQKKRFFKPCLYFSTLFPIPYELFMLIKEVRNNYFPIILQRIESYLIIDIICKRINKFYPEIPLFTIHDNIITTLGNEGVVDDILKEEIERWTGYLPRVETEYLYPKEKEYIES